MSQWSDPGAGAQYDDARPPWPSAVREFLASLAPASGWARAADLAAGTGKLTAQILPIAAEVVAVEPSASMLAVLRRRLPQVEAILGRAEAIPLASATVDLVVAGNAFHWFDPEVAAGELRRVLRPGGVVAALWHAPQWPAWHDDMSARLSAYRNPGFDEAIARAESGAWQRGLERRFGPLTTTPIVDATLAWSRDAFTRLVASTSYVAALDHGRRQDAVRIISRYVSDKPEPILLPHRAEATWVRKGQ